MNYGLVALLVVVGGLIYIDHLTKKSQNLEDALAAEGIAHRNTKLALANVQQQLQQKISEFNVLKTKVQDSKDRKA